MARKNAIVADIPAPDEEGDRPPGNELVKGGARFSDELTLEVDGGRVRRERDVLACGARAAVPACVVLGDGGETQADVVLAATGRAPATLGLGLDRAGVRISKRGVHADDTMRTSHERIWAAGDVLGGLLYTHVASYEGHL